MAYDIAVTQGFKIPFDNVAIFGSHSHSGPGAISPEMLWAIAPAIDLLVPGSSVCIGILDKVVGNIRRAAENVGYIDSQCNARGTGKPTGGLNRNG